MARNSVDKRTSILVVEDIETTRNMYVRNLELEGGYSVDMAKDLSEAVNALERRAYQVALVDIMLAGPKDTANRDGIKVLQRIRELGEGTQAVVLSAQKDTQLVREFIKEYSAFDYLDKDSLNKAGLDKMFDFVARAAKKSPVGDQPSWEAVVECLAGGRTERMFVSDIMNLSFSGGFENLSRTLPAAVRYLLPLMPPEEGSQGLTLRDEEGRFVARYWSKGQGCAVEVTLRGKDGPRASAPAPEDDGVFLEREKGGLEVVVSRLADVARSAFAASTP